MGRVVVGFVPHGPVEPRVPLAQARVLVAGFGVTGQAVAGALARDDEGPGLVGSVVTTAPARAGGTAADIPLPTDAAARAALLADTDVVVTSPGFRPADPLLDAARAAGVPVWSEAELAWRLRVDRVDGAGASRGPAPWLAVTGTNGKTTTVEMLASILTAAGLRTRAVGNVGTPLVEAALDPDLDVLAVELSSFQLHFTHTMAAEASAMLNLAQDHLDWHGSLTAYGDDKGRIFECVQRACVYNAADPATELQAREAEVAEGALAVGFTLGVPGPGMLGVVEDVLVDRAFHAPADALDRRRSAAELATLDDLAHLAPGGLVPPHVVANALAAAGLARAHGVPAGAVRDGLRAFHAGGHRIHAVATVDGVTYVDDSKATNAHSAAASLAGFAAGSVVWLAGGLAKGASFEELVATRADRLRAAVVIGTDPRPYSAALARHAPQIPVVVVDPGDTGTVMRRAVDAARSLARQGDTVLLAPAGASHDQFRSYAHRGDAFAAAVAALSQA